MFGEEPEQVSPQMMTTSTAITRTSQFFLFSRRDFGGVAVPALKTAFLVYLWEQLPSWNPYQVNWLLGLGIPK